MRTLLMRWMPAVIVMFLIFFFSSQPSAELPNFNWADTLIKKAGHMVGYGMLAFSYLHAVGRAKQQSVLAWMLTILYAISDEMHQSFVPGRHASAWDVIIFDNLGAIVALSLANVCLRRRPYARAGNPTDEPMDPED